MCQSSVQELDMDVDDAFKMIISGGVLTPGIEPAEVRSRPTKCDTHYMQGFQAFLLIAGLWGKRASVVLGAALVYFMFFAKVGYQSVAAISQIFGTLR